MALAGKLEIRLADNVREVALPAGGLSIGRNSDNQVVLDHPHISRRHASLELAGGVLRLTDLGSSNGTRLNGVELEPKVPRPVPEGAEMQLGPFTLIARLARPTEAAVAAETRVHPGATVVMAAPPPSRLLVKTPAGQHEVRLDREVMTLGRGATNDVVIDDPTVSRQHARLRRVGGRYEIEDLGSVNGLTHDGQRVASVWLREAGVVHLSAAVSVAYQAAAAMTEVHAPAQTLDLRGRSELSIGRGTENDVRLAQHTAVSRRHARVVGLDGGHGIEDLGSTNGTFVNGQQVAPGQVRALRPDDVIRIGPVNFVVAADALRAVDESRDLRLDALHLFHAAGKSRTLLHDISLSILPHEFVALVGVSGAGKSTLLNALSGFRPARAGAVRVNGHDLYRNFDGYRNDLGYVPQADIIHKELAVYEALDYAARLRLPADTTPAERHERVVAVIENLGLSEQRDLPIHRLSGGQTKRVSIGVELLTEPGLFFLDEATSGLDPGTESQLMRLLRKLADQGHTIVLVTHATKNVMLCDQVIFLARGGHLAFYGPPEVSLRYFGVADFDAIYEKLESEPEPETWAARFRAAPEFQTFVVQRLEQRYGAQALAAEATQPASGRAARPKAAPRRISALRQFITLSRRNLAILRRDRASLFLMLLTAPFIGLLNYSTWRYGVFETAGGDPVHALIGLFLMALNGVFIGAVSSMREIVKEDDVCRRERMVVLRLGPYVLSKTWVGLLLALYQAAIFVAVARLASGWPDTPQAALATYVTLALTGLVGMFFGLLISAASANPNVTPLLLIVVLIPQLLFAGAMLPINTFGPAGPVLSRLTVTRWSFESLIVISELGRDLAGDVCWQLPAAERDALSEADKRARCACAGPALFERCQFPGLAGYYDAAVDEPEPLQPVEPQAPSLVAAPPTLGPDASAEELAQHQEALAQYQDALAQFQQELEDYQIRAEAYRAEVEAWRARYQAWQEGRGRAINQAEAVLQRVNDDFGEMFRADLAVNWGVLVLMMGGLLVLIVAAQRRKDVV